MQMIWIYKDSEITPEVIGDSYGFVYIITNKLTSRRYIGRKYFTKAGYKTTNGKKKKIRVSSGWENYWGSNKVLLDDVAKHGPENFTRHIVKLCRNRSECSYWETHYIFQCEALLSDRFYNEWVSCKISKKNVIDKKT
jgi:hypothetical protein